VPIPFEIKKGIDRFVQNLIEHYAIESLPNIFNFTFATNGKKRKATVTPTCEERKMQSRIVKLLRVTSHFSVFCFDRI